MKVSEKFATRGRAFVFIFLGAFVLSGCGSSGNNTETVTGKGVIRGLHAIPDLGSVSFMIEETLLGNIDFKESSGTSEFDDLTYQFNFDIWLPDDDEATRLASLETSIMADTEYTYILAGSLDDPEIILWEQFSRDWNTLLDEAAANDTVVSILDVAFGHLAQSLGPVDIFLAEPGVAPTASTLRASLSYGELQPSLELDAGDWQLVITEQGQTSPYLFASNAFTLPSATDVTVVLLDGDDTNTSPFNVRLLGSGTATSLVPIDAPAGITTIHAADNTDALDIIASDDFENPLFSNLVFGDRTAEAAVDAGTLNLNITPAGNPGSFYAEETLLLGNAQRYTFFLTGLPGQLDGVLANAGTRRLATHARFRFYQGASRFDLVDVYVIPAGSDISLLSPTLPSVAYTGTSGFLSFEPGDYDIVLTWPGSKTVVAGPLRVELDARGIYESIGADSRQTDVAQLLMFEVPQVQ